MKEFIPFPKMARLTRECIITEKIDGTNAQICITDEGEFLVGSRSRWITPDNDNFGFAAWAYAHREELMLLGPGSHFGEWWGRGIQRGYGIQEKVFSLFNVRRWCLHSETPRAFPTSDPRVTKSQEILPSCCSLVPLLYEGSFDTQTCKHELDRLQILGSVAAPGFMKPEGIVCYHIAAGVGFKKTIEKDESPKGLA